MSTKPWPILTETGLDTAALPAPLRARKQWHYTVGDAFALPPEQCAAAFGVMAATPQHRYTVEAGPGAAGWFAWFKQAAEFHAIACDCSDEEGRLRTLQDFGARAVGVDDSLDATPWLVITACPWPLPNVHLVTPPCSAQAELDERAPRVLRCPAAARVLRLVPAGALDVRPWLSNDDGCEDCDDNGMGGPGHCRRSGIPRCEQCPTMHAVFADDVHGTRVVFDLVTLRGGTAPVHPDWVRSVRDQCAAAGVAFRFDGWGEWSCVYDRDKDDPGHRRCAQRHKYDERYLNLAGGHGFHGERVVSVRKVGAKASGRLLDGVTHDGEVPPC